MKAGNFLLSLFATAGSNNKHATRSSQQQPKQPGSRSSSSIQPTTITYEVCQSPGCVADGSVATLEKLRALAPPHVDVRAGGCASACGNGPIVQCLETKKCTRKVVSNAKILELLLLADNESSISPDLVQAYDTAVEADQAFHKQQFAQALELYSKLPTPSVLFPETAVELGTISTTAMWLVRAKRHEALSHLRVVDSSLDQAVVAAREACAMSNSNKDGAYDSADSHRVLAEICQAMGDTHGELQALRTYFGQLSRSDTAETTLTFTAKNERRELGFRLAKLKRECKNSS